LFWSLLILLIAPLLSAAFFAGSEVTPENVSVRARLICEGAHVSAPLVNNTIVRVLLANVDCRCVVQRMADDNRTADYALVFEAYRKTWTENPAALIPPWQDVALEPGIRETTRIRMFEHIGTGVFLCQSAR
jgi:hypothetical protein